jgi:hypothetical protein
VVQRKIWVARGQEGKGIFVKSHLSVNFSGFAALTKIGGREMKTLKIISIVLLIVLLISVPVVADAHWGFGGGLLLGLGTGLITGFAFAPRPVYVAPPVYYAPPPPVAYPYRVPAPVPPDPAASGYSNNASVSSANPPPVGQSGCPGMENDQSALGEAMGPELWGMADRTGGEMGLGRSALQPLT